MSRINCDLVTPEFRGGKAVFETRVEVRPEEAVEFALLALRCLALRGGADRYVVRIAYSAFYEYGDVEAVLDEGHGVLRAVMFGRTWIKAGWREVSHSRAEDVAGHSCVVSGTLRITGSEYRGMVPADARVEVEVDLKTGLGHLDEDAFLRIARLMGEEYRYIAAVAPSGGG